MSQDAPANGADGSDTRERPSWYVPIRARETGDPTTQELLDRLIDIGDPEELGPAADDIDAYLRRFLQPSDL